jgi:hypothetical protein
VVWCGDAVERMREGREGELIYEVRLEQPWTHIRYIAHLTPLRDVRRPVHR